MAPGAGGRTAGGSPAIEWLPPRSAAYPAHQACWISPPPFMCPFMPCEPRCSQLHIYTVGRGPPQAGARARPPASTSSVAAALERHRQLAAAAVIHARILLQLLQGPQGHLELVLHPGGVAQRLRGARGQAWAAVARCCQSSSACLQAGEFTSRRAPCARGTGF